MECFCKGVIFGMIAGVCVGAIVVAKNKKLSNKISDGVEVAEEKIKEIKEGLEDKFNSTATKEFSTSESMQGYGNREDFTTKFESGISNNNFSKKDKK